MKCHAWRTADSFILEACEVEVELESSLIASWYEKQGSGYQRRYDLGQDGTSAPTAHLDEVCENFAALGPTMFSGDLQWESTVVNLARAFQENGVEWYILGSASDAIRGVDVVPHDLDIVVHTRHWTKVRDLFQDRVVEPMMDHGTDWMVRFYGRIACDPGYIDVMAAEHLNGEQHVYEAVKWRNIPLQIETFENRRAMELRRGRADRVKALDTWRQQNR